jgi:alanyl-tRNA synthetase
LASQLKSATEELPQKISLLMANAKDSEKQLTATKQKLLAYQASELIEKATAYQDINILFTKISNIDSKSIRTMIDILKQKLDNTVIALALVTDKGVSIAVGISKELTKKLHAGKLLNIIAAELGGKGGGRPDFAQGAGVEAKNIDKAFTVARNWIEQNY